MATYIATLERLKKMRLSRIAPGHGDVIEEPRARIDEYLQHRLAREKQILKILKQHPAKIREIVATLYPDLAEPLVEVAGKQVHAHLLKLRSEGKVTGRDAKSTWSLA
jgi:hydroxyacylglutathione hydrolase